MLNEVLKKLNIFPQNEHIEVSTFKSLEENQDYNVWKVSFGNENYVLKKSSANEISTYKTYLKNLKYVPIYVADVNYCGDDFLLIEYVKGDSLTNLNKEHLHKIITALNHVQNKFWNANEFPNCGLSFEESVRRREDRKKYLFDSELQRVYDKYLHSYKILQRTLCHDDLLPFNALIGEDNATIIDWEVAGILPYPTSIARLIAHAEENENCFFYMTENSKDFAINLYYKILLKNKGISYEEYKSSLNLFIFYEYCEWIMVGNKYENANKELYNKYLNKAKLFILQNNL